MKKTPEKWQFRKLMVQKKKKKILKGAGYERFEMMLVILGSRRMFLIYPNYP